MSDIAQRTQEAFKLYESSFPNEVRILALIKQGVDVTATDNDKQTLLHWASYKGHWDVCKLLINNSADIHAQDNDGSTSLHNAAHNAHAAIIKILLEQGADIHARDNDGDTPLHDVVSSENTKGIKFLLKYGANIWAEKNEGVTVLNEDETGLIEIHRDEWMQKLDTLKGGEYSRINTPQDIYHLASVMKPKNSKNVPPPKEFIRILFQQHLPHEEKFNTIYSEIFGQSRPPIQDLKAVRAAAAKSMGVVP